MQQNYLGGEKGPQINAFMAETAWNLKKMVEKLKEKILQIIFRVFFSPDFHLSLMLYHLRIKYSLCIYILYV